MFLAFYKASSFNGNISNWNVSNVTDMGSMFYNATSFNQNLSKWDVSSVFNQEYMFENTPAWTLPKPNFINPYK